METKPTIFSPGFLEHPRTSEQAGRKKLRFSYGDDLVLLKEVIALNPFEKNQRWEDVRSNVCFLTGKSFSTRSCREHTELLIKLLRKSDTNNLRKGSPEQQFEEKMRLLQQVFDMSEEYATKKSKPSPNTTPVHPPTHLVRLHPKQENAPKYVDSQGTTFVLDGSATFASNGLVAEDTEMSSIVDEDCNSAGSAGNSPVEDFTSSHEENAAHESQHGEGESMQNVSSVRYDSSKEANVTFLGKKTEIELELKRQEISLQERKLNLEEKRLEVEEKRLQLEEEKFHFEKEERRRKLDMEIDERRHRLQQQTAQNTMMQLLVKSLCEKEINK